MAVVCAMVPFTCTFLVCQSISSGKEYVVYSIDTDSENCDVLVSRLEKQSDGTDEIFDIEDEIEREKIHNIVNELLNA